MWKDKKNIDFIQTICLPGEAGTVMRKNKDGTRTAVSCPLAVKLYNEHMGGVDLAACKFTHAPGKPKSGGTDYFTSFWTLVSSMLTYWSQRHLIVHAEGRKSSELSWRKR